MDTMVWFCQLKNQKELECLKQLLYHNFTLSVLALIIFNHIIKHVDTGC